MSGCYDHKPDRLPPIQLAAALVRQHGDNPLCCQAAATIRDLLDELREQGDARSVQVKAATAEMTKRYRECLTLMRRAERSFRREGWEAGKSLEEMFDEIASYIGNAKLADELEGEMR